MFAFVFVTILGLCSCSQENNQSVLGRPQLFGPPEALLETVVNLNCKLQTYPKNESILLQLYKEGNRKKVLAEYTSMAGETATFPLYVRPHHDGNLECVAKAQNNSRIEPTVSHTHHLRVIVPVEGSKVVVSSGQQELFEGRTLDLRCSIDSGSYVSYTWYLDDRHVSASSHHRAAGERLLISSVTSKDSGLYVCVANNTFNGSESFNSTSDAVLITVKDLVSKPDISFSVLKDDSLHFAVVTCQSTKGHPPVIFKLFNGTVQIRNTMSNETKATFKVPLVLGQHSERLRCQAHQEERTVYSEWIPLKVEAVGGPVTLRYESDVGENFAVIGLRLFCKATKGTHLRYQWFLNGTLLSGRGSFYFVVHQPPEYSMLVMSVGRSSAGTYHCEASDSFDDSNTVRSKRRYLDREVVNRLPLLVVVVVFGCFAFLILLVSVCCWIGALFRRREYGEIYLWNLEMKRSNAAYEGELDVTEYDEDVDLASAAGGGEFDQTSEASVDEWPQIVKRRRTIEDEAFGDS